MLLFNNWITLEYKPLPRMKDIATFTPSGPTMADLRRCERYYCAIEIADVPAYVQSPF